MVLSKSPGSALLLLLVLNFTGTLGVWELDSTNFDKFRKAAEFAIFYIDSPSCSRCRVLYPFFYAAAQMFREDRKIFFGRVADKVLLRDWGIEDLPVIHYYEEGENISERLEGDITVDNIVETISSAMPDYFGDVKHEYVVEVTDANFEELVVTPKQHALVLVYDSNTQNARSILDQIAPAFRNDEQVILTAVDFTKYPKLKTRFGHSEVPAVYWYFAHNKDKKYRYYAKLHASPLLEFVNEKTNLWRNKDGTLHPRSGRVSAFDKIFEKHAHFVREKNMEGVKSAIAEMKNTDVEQEWEADFAEYYIELLEHIAETGEYGEPLRRERDDILIKLDQEEDLTQKQRDFIMRKRNVLNYIIEVIRTAPLDRPVITPVSRKLMRPKRLPLRDEL